jgi:5'-3' exoribonuclease 2
LNGKKFAWQGVALLPFVDERRLLATLTNVYDRLDVDECARNMTSTDRLFVGSKHPAYAFIKELYDGAGDESIASADWIDIDAQFTHGMAGRLGRAESVVLPGTRLVSPIPDPEQCPDIEVDNFYFSLLIYVLL